MKKAYMFRVYPNKNQEVILNRTLSTCRHLYNNSISERRKQSELNELKRSFGVFPWGKPDWIIYYDQAGSLTTTKTPYQKDVFSQLLQNVLKRVDRSFKNFYNGFGYPRFQGRDRYNSFTYPQSGFGLEDGKLNLSKIGNIKIIQHREIEGTIKTCTIKKDIELVNARKTSQNCSGCGNSVPKDLSVRVHSCPVCGLVLDRDHNAAINILKRRITVGTSGINACQGPLNRGSMQQEATLLVGW